MAGGATKPSGGKKNVILLKSRQVGASWIAGAYVVWLLVFFTNVEIYLYSDGERKAISLLRKIRFMYKSVPAWMRHEIVEDNKKRFAIAVKVNDKGRRITVSLSSVDSYPSSPNASRSESPTFVLFDEHAAQDNDAELWEGIIPSLQHGGHICSVSTPKGYDCVYATVWEAVASGLMDNWIPMTVHYTDCGFTKDWVMRNAVGLTPAQINQEFELQFTQGDNPVFSASDLAACYKPLAKTGTVKLMSEWNALRAIAGMSPLTHEEFEIEYNVLIESINATRETYTGVDTSEGTGNDQHAITTLNEFGIQIGALQSNARLPQWAGYTNEEGIEVDGIVWEWYKSWGGWMIIEENGPGLTVYNRLRYKDAMGRIRVKRAADNQFRTGLKTRVINDLVILLAGRQITITDKRTYEQLLSYQRDENTGKTGAPKGKLDDAVMALAWAYHALSLHGIKTFETRGGMVGGSRLFDFNIGEISHIGQRPTLEGPRLGVLDSGNGLFGDIDLSRIRGLK